MTNSTRKKMQRTRLGIGTEDAKKAKKAQKAVKSQTKASEYTDCLIELHKLQGTLLTRLKKEV